MDRFLRRQSLRLVKPGPYGPRDRKSTRLNSSHSQISYAVFCLKKKNLTVRHRISCPGAPFRCAPRFDGERTPATPSSLIGRSSFSLLLTYTVRHGVPRPRLFVD